MSKLKLDMNMVEMLVTMSEGNPGAVSALTAIVAMNAEADPCSFAGPMSTLFNLDSNGIYGSDIWVLYKDVCAQEPLDVVVVMRCVQMGILPIQDVKDAMVGKATLNLELLRNNLAAKLPDFRMGAELRNKQII